MKRSSKNRLMPIHQDLFPEDTLFHRIARTVCRAGLLAQIMLILDRTSPLALAVDTRIPKSAETLLAAMSEPWPFLLDRVCFEPRFRIRHRSTS